MFKATMVAWIDDYAPSMGAALSYYTVFSLAPLLVIVISVAGLMFGADAVRGAIFSQIDGLMGADAARAIEDLLSSVSKPSTGILGTVLGVVVLLIGATTVFGELQDALDRIWRAPARAKTSGLVTLVRTRILSFGMILGIAFLLMVSLVAGAGIAALGKWWGGWFEGWEVLAQIINAALGFVMTTAVFALIYKLMPRVKVSWGDVWVGATVTALLFTLGRFLISLYIGKTGVASGFGACGFGGGGLRVGLLLCAGLLGRRRVHLGLRPAFRIAPSAGRTHAGSLARCSADSRAKPGRRARSRHRCCSRGCHVQPSGRACARCGRVAKTCGCKRVRRPAFVTLAAPLRAAGAGCRRCCARGRVGAHLAPCALAQGPRFLTHRRMPLGRSGPQHDLWSPSPVGIMRSGP